MMRSFIAVPAELYRNTVLLPPPHPDAPGALPGTRPGISSLSG
ncbi:MAG TPA: hypothetical protein PLM60_06895 [Methanoregulaceae archaeon]|nr:hypothetical protein [Methanoregulaceae archaeon]HNO08055.1 hypothetical protein [Methanoregulaceae archaeon]HOU81528.1 hypothetical protein [Methanoregulaceae archaeon]HPA07549.1 hypothetical protein [Methanoregulaceae archaeon]HPS23115.1 hypothetical protein [Methanoregulaceae archaeon]